MVEVVERDCWSFYIRGKRCAKMGEMIGTLPKEIWGGVIRLGIQEMGVAEIPC